MDEAFLCRFPNELVHTYQNRHVWFQSTLVLKGVNVDSETYYISTTPTNFLTMNMTRVISCNSVRAHVLPMRGTRTSSSSTLIVRQPEFVGEVELQVRYNHVWIRC